MDRLRAFRIGLTDGLTQPYDLVVGMTYEDGTDRGDGLQTAWDYGANLGQRLGYVWANRPRPLHHVTDLWRTEPPWNR